MKPILLAFGKTNGVDYQINDLLSMPAITAYSYDNQTAFNAAVDDVNENEIRETPCDEDPQCLCELSRYWAQFIYEVDCDDQRIMYWYHPDYLGNTEYITDLNGDPYQYFWYSPWGESLESQHKHPRIVANYYDSPYAFNAKELDAETGNYYYGARYYDPKVSVWLSADPMASSYPHLTPYNFLENNPVMYVDPRGMNSSPIYDENGQRLGVDSEGFKGDIIIMNRDEYNKRTENNTKTLDHSEALANGKVMDKGNVSKEVRQNIVNDVMCGYTLPDGTVLNEKNLSVTSTDDYKKNEYNANASYHGKENGKHQVSEHGFHFEYTVENIQAVIGIHETYAHGVLGLSGGWSLEHIEVFKLTLDYASPNITNGLRMNESVNLVNMSRHLGEMIPKKYYDIYVKSGGKKEYE